MNIHAKENARRKELMEKLHEKYDRKDELSTEKKAVLESWVKDVEKQSEKHSLDPKDEKDRQLVIKLAKQIEEREAKRTGG